MFRIAADQLHDIAPPVDYSLLPVWVVFVGTFLLFGLIGLFVWWLLRRRGSSSPPQLPRDRALEQLERIQSEIEFVKPYQFSIAVSDVLRSYVHEQFGMPITRQTSVEFLNQIRNTTRFTPPERSLLEDFLGRCDLIKFARYDASTADSRLLLDEAIRFVKGGERLVAATA